jgi:hypothetical protein
MAPRDRYLLLFLLGLGLVLNPVYLFPDGVPHEEEITYQAEQVEGVAEAHRDLPTFAVLDCSDAITHRECVQARQIGYDGRRVVENDTPVALVDDERGLYFAYDYVRFDRGYAAPNASVDNGTLVLSFSPVSQRRVLRDYAAPFEVLPPVGKEAIRDGTASTTRRFAEFNDVDRLLVDEDLRIVNRDGTFYRLELERKVTDRQFPPWILDVVRLGGVIGGAVLAFVASGRYARAAASGAESKGEG